jgi:cardiolipin synthase
MMMRFFDSDKVGTFWQSDLFFWQLKIAKMKAPITKKEPTVTTKKILFTHVKDFYKNYVSEIETAQEAISMMYYAFDHGEWAEKISKVLIEKAKAGVRVRLMQDGFGMVLDEVSHAFKNRRLIKDLRDAGVEVDIFDPSGYGLSKLNRLHCKVCAIDQRTVFLGGSNIGDHYPTWDDSNLRLDGDFGDTFHDVYDYVRQFSKGQKPPTNPGLNLSQLIAGDSQVWMTIPKQRCDIRQALLKLIREADKVIYIRTWYFLPDQEILEMLREKAEKGVEVNVLLSHKTRVRPIDFANYVHAHKLAKSGGRIFRYTPKYMHAKVAWNNHGDVLFGSANLENMAMENTFECCIAVRDPELATQLRRVFEADTHQSIQQTPEIFRGRPAPKKALSYACNLASPWL